MKDFGELPLPKLDALPLGAHRLSLLTDERLFERVGVRVAFTNRNGGFSEAPFASLNMGDHVGDDLSRVQRNRQRVLESLGAGECPLVVPLQVHGDRIVTVGDRAEVERCSNEARQGADGLAVAVPGVAAALCGADCPLVVIVSPSGRFALAHAGWRGAIAHIASKAAGELSRIGGGDMRTYNAYIGPHIGPECFEVSAEIAQQFSEAYGLAAAPDARHVDLSQAIRADLVAAGMDGDRIVSSGICTKCHSDQYYSYRASGGECGRHSALALWFDKQE